MICSSRQNSWEPDPSLSQRGILSQDLCGSWGEVTSAWPLSHRDLGLWGASACAGLSSLSTAELALVS